MGEFLNLVKNIDKIKFDCDEKSQKIIKNSAINVFLKLDKFFIQNDLYSCNDFKYIVDKMLNGNFQFSTYDQNLMRHSVVVPAGFCDQKGIALSFGSLKYEQEELENIICHEVFHWLTSNEFFAYKKDGKDYLLNITRGYFKLVNKLEINPNGQNKTIISNFTYAGNRVIEEALTELSKQAVYSINQKVVSYPAETRMVALLNEFAFKNKYDFIKSYLRGDIPEYDEFFSKQDFNEFLQLIGNADENEEFTTMIEARKGINYCKAEKIIVKTMLNNIMLHKYSKDKIIYNIAFAYHNCLHIENYKDLIEQTITKYVQINYLGQNTDKIIKQMKDLIDLEIQKMSNCFEFPDYIKNVVFKYENDELKIGVKHSNSFEPITKALNCTYRIGELPPIQLIIQPNKDYIKIQKSENKNENEVIVYLDKNSKSKFVLENKAGNRKFIDLQTHYETNKKHQYENIK